ncbi:hypothetical protein LTR60_005403, partial [Cryomyces antarcticus]
DGSTTSSFIPPLHHPLGIRLLDHKLPSNPHGTHPPIVLDTLAAHPILDHYTTLTPSPSRGKTTMHALALSTRLLPRRALPLSLAHRAFSTTPHRGLREDRDRTPAEAEQTKQEQLRKQQQGKGEWHEDLASAGESSVKADRGDVGGGQSVEELQKQTAQQAEADHPEGKRGK